jgi:TorA maturation chaperone TorD
MGPPAIQVQSAYAAAGFAVAPELTEPPDHAGVELASIAELLDRRASAQGAADRESVAAIAGQVQSFCSEHPMRWLPALQRRIAGSGAPSFYAAVALLAANLVEQASKGTVQSLAAIPSGCD